MENNFFSLFALVKFHHYRENKEEISQKNPVKFPLENSGKFKILICTTNHIYYNIYNIPYYIFINQNSTITCNFLFINLSTSNHGVSIFPRNPPTKFVLITKINISKS